MKKEIIAIIAAAVLVPSCSLDENLYTYIDESTYITDAASARNVLFGLYRNLCSLDLYGDRLSIVYDLPTDIAKVDGNSLVNNRDFCCNAHTASNSWVQNTWRYAYNTIYNANDFMEKVASARSRIPEDDQAAVDVYVAEARVIRALMYFELVRNWENISLFTTTAQSRLHPSTFRQEDPETVYGFIETELREAAEVLPWATEDNIRTDNSFMISKGSALGLLARVYVTWAGYPLLDTDKWTDAKEVCEEIITSGKHGLLADYEELWRNACNSVWNPTESLFEISFYSPMISSSGANNCSGYIGKWNGVYVVTNTSPLVRVDARYRAVTTFAARWPDIENDRRFYLSMADYYYEGTDKLGYSEEDNRWYEESGIDGIRKVYRVGYGRYKVDFTDANSPVGETLAKDAYKDGLYVAKWDLTKYQAAGDQLSDGNLSNAHWYLIRYSDVLLMYAEAVNEISGPTSEAYNAVNMVRRRGYGLDVNSTEPTIADLATGMGQEEFRQAIRDERAYELCFEGQRKQDLIRWGIYYDTIVQTGIDLDNWRSQFYDNYLAATYTIEGRHELQPIPQRELDLMPLYEQNTGWKE